MLVRLDGAQSAAALCQAFQVRFGQGLSETELQEFIDLAQARGFLQSSASGERAVPLPSGPCGGESEATHCSYDQVPYTSKPFPQTHPDNLATVASLFGMSPPPVERCRVLELGCAGGGNLIPLAVSLPQGRFLGIDLSHRQVADGRRVVDALGLRNIELWHGSILDVSTAFGQFDYIICHGVYSWVPAVVQDKILQVCSRNVAPNGVAYVSYNTYPGWHVPGAVRAMMRYHAGRFAEPAVRVLQARAFLEFLARSEPPENDPYGGAVEKERALLGDVADYYLYHEYFSEVNTPVYFHEFNERAQAKGLQHLGEAAFLDMLPEYLPPDVESTLRLLGQDLVQAEQYMDFLRNRRFRQTLLCHRRVSLERNLSLDCLEHMQDLADLAERGLLAVGPREGAQTDQELLGELLDQSLWRLARHALLAG